MAKAAAYGLGIVCFALVADMAGAAQFNVGGGNGDWSVPGAGVESYNTWAMRNRFQVGDALVFVYPKDKDAVLLVQPADYNSCNTTSYVRKFADGNTVYTLDRSGALFFISGVEANCRANEKLIVMVLASRNGTGTGAPLPSSSPASAPPPSSPVAPPPQVPSSAPPPASTPPSTSSPPEGAATPPPAPAPKAPSPASAPPPASSPTTTPSSPPPASSSPPSPPTSSPPASPPSSTSAPAPAGAPPSTGTSSTPPPASSSARNGAALTAAAAACIIGYAMLAL